MQPIKVSSLLALLALSVSDYAQAQWALTGNAGTNATHYLGTSDAASFQVRVNNKRALLVDANNNWLGGPVGDPSFLGANNAVAGGFNNVAANVSFVGAGQLNRSTGKYSAVLGGESNSSDWHYSAVSGGFVNLARGEWAAASGGSWNSVEGRYSYVPGGDSNYAKGDYSFAAGKYAAANALGCFMWSDSKATTTLRACTRDNAFMGVAAGGFHFFTGVGGAYLAPGSGTWANMSDRYAKRDIAGINVQRVLASLSALPISTWSYRGEKPANGQGVRHMGPMAQDFHEAFRLGDRNTSIASVDGAGVALAAIQALQLENSALRARNARLRTRAERLAARLSSGASRAGQTDDGTLMLGAALAVGAFGCLRRRDR